jgi:hypothetical protein
VTLRQPGRMSPDPEEVHALYSVTRRSLHAVAETLLAGPQHRATGSIRLSVRDDGFCTQLLRTDPRSIAVRTSRLVVTTPSGDRSAPLTGTIGELAARLDLDAGPPVGLYDTSASATLGTAVVVDGSAASTLVGALFVGDQALRRAGRDALGHQAPEPVLWPEHFDVGISLDEINLGVSPGDAGIPEPYAYVAPWVTRRGPFWNVSFGAARRLTELGGVDDVTAYFKAGLEAARTDSPA